MAELFEEGFKESLELVKEDIATRWPIFRAEKRPQKVIYDAIVEEVSEMDSADDLPYCLDLYSTCLAYIHQYKPNRKRKAHVSSIARGLKIHAPAILKGIWEGFFFMHPFFPDNLDPKMISSTTNFVTRLFDLDDFWEDADDFEDPNSWLTNLCVATPLVLIVDHCFFFAEDSTLRQSSWKIRSVVREMNEPLDMHPPQDYYKLLKVDLVRERFDHLLSGNLAPGPLLGVLEDLKYYEVVGKGPHPLWNKALNKGVTLLDEYASGREKIKNFQFFEYVDTIHEIVKRVVKHCSVPLRVVLKDISANHHGAEVVASATLSAAKRCRYYLPHPSEADEDKTVWSTIFFLPFVMKEMSRFKRWTAPEFDFLAQLAKANVSVWKATFDSLRALEASRELPKSKNPDPEPASDSLSDSDESISLADSDESNSLPAFICHWARYGTLMGIQNLVSPIRGCCHADCLVFLQETEHPLARCSGCQQVWYCSENCQKSDWKLHKHYCAQGQTPGRVA